MSQTDMRVTGWSNGLSWLNSLIPRFSTRTSNHQLIFFNQSLWPHGKLLHLIGRPTSPQETTPARQKPSSFGRHQFPTTASSCLLTTPASLETVPSCRLPPPGRKPLPSIHTNFHSLLVFSTLTSSRKPLISRRHRFPTTTLPSAATSLSSLETASSLYVSSSHRRKSPQLAGNGKPLLRRCLRPSVFFLSKRKLF